MNLRGIPGITATLPQALPIRREGGDTGALLLHGFTGTPRDLAGLADLLHRNGMSVSVPRLPGHGTSGRDFLQSGWRDWLRSAVDAYLDLRARCTAVHVIGFSMGGILAVLLASQFPVQRLVLLAPALKAKNPLLPWSPMLAMFIRRMPWQATALQPAHDEHYTHLAREYWSWRYPGQAASLLRLKRMASRALKGVTADALTIVGAMDRSVPLSVIPFIESRVAAARTRHLVLETSPHLILSGPDKDRASAEILQWLVG
jgi:carboxylesterase